MKHWMLTIGTAISFVSFASQSVEVSSDVQRYNDLQNELMKLKQALPEIESETSQKHKDLVTREKQAISEIYDVQLRLLFEQQQQELIQAIQDLKVLIEQRSDDPSFTPSALFLLGDREFVLADKSDENGGRADYDPTIESYSRIVKDFPNFIYLDAVLYMLGICHNFMGKDTASLSYFQRLVEQFPKSRFVAESRFRIGNTYFDQRRFRDAINAYSPLVSGDSTSFQERALYKSAWAHYLLSEFQEAIKGFVEVLDKRDSDSATTRDSVLDQEAKEYLAFSFADLGLDESDDGVEIVANVSRFFANRKRTVWEREVWLNLGRILSKLSRTEGAALAFERAIFLSPSSTDSSEIFARIISIYEQMNLKERELKARAQLVASNVLSKDDALLSENLYALGVGYHVLAKEKAKRGKNDEAMSDYRKALEFYTRYVREFNHEGNVDEVLEYLAEAQFGVKNFENSALVYAQVRDWPWPSSRKDEAALNVVYSLEEAIAQEQKIGSLPAFNLGAINQNARLQAATPLPPVLSNYIGSVDILSRLLPKNELTPAFLFKAANVDFIYGNTAEANTRLQKIIAGYPQSISARLAATMLVNEKIAQNDWPAVAKDATEFASSMPGSEKEFGKIAYNARFKQANGLFVDGKFLEAAQIYARLRQENPKSEFADKILFNEVIALDKSGNTTARTLVLEQLLKDYRISELARNALFSTIKSDASRLSLKEAAAGASRYVKLFPGASNAGDLILDECFYLEAAQEYKKAAQACEVFGVTYPARVEAIAALVKAAKLLARSGDKVSQRKILERIIRQSQENQQPESLAYAKYTLLEDEFLKYERMKIDAQLGKNQTAQLTGKTSRLADLKKKYEKIIVDAGVSRWSVASLQRIGSLYEGLYRSLLDAPCPRDVERIDDAACDEYKSVLEDKAFVLEQKSIESYELALKKAAKVDDSLEASLLARDGLHRLQPDKYPLASLPIFDSDLRYAKTSSGSLGEELMAEGKYEAARIFFENGVASENQEPKAHLQLAKVLAKLGLDASARNEFQKVLSLDQNNAEAFDGLGLIAIQASDYDAARESFENASNRNKSAAIYASHLANAYYLLGNWGKALIENQKAQGLDGEMVSLSFNLGLLYLVGSFDQIDDVKRLSLSKSEFERYLQSSSAEEKKKTASLLKLVEQKLFIEKQRQQREAK